MAPFEACHCSSQQQLLVAEINQETVHIGTVGIEGLPQIESNRLLRLAVGSLLLH